MSTKIESTLARIREIAEDAYEPEATREDLAEALGEILAVLDGEEDDEDEE